MDGMKLLRAFISTAALLIPSLVIAQPANKEAKYVSTETAILAGGCFWGMEDLLRKIPGVLDTEVGYVGGVVENPTYQLHTGHAEAVKVVFDPAKISFAELLEKHFFRMHDPTTLNRQGNAVGDPYRSAIFSTSEAQKKTAEEDIARVEAGRGWERPVAAPTGEAPNLLRGRALHQAYH